MSQLYQEKALRKGVVENHYVVEGAKRIHLKHVPAHCPAIHIPQWCLDDERGCLSRLPHLLTSGDAAGMSHDCIFVVRLNGERSVAAVAPTVRAMQQAFQKVWIIAEDMLEFPLSDLWQMGDHYMVTLMQSHLVRHLWQYVVVLPHKGAQLERFDAEVLKRRSEDTGKGVLEVTLDDTVPHLRPPQTVACPCPEYPDNKMLKDVGLEMQHTLYRYKLPTVISIYVVTSFRKATRKLTFENVLFHITCTGHVPYYTYILPSSGWRRRVLMSHLYSDSIEESW